MNTVNVNYNSQVSHEETVKRKTRTHFYWLDALRGLAALTVLFWHYHHFYLTDAEMTYFDLNGTENQPFHTLLLPFYTVGYYAVQFFWMLSGFVFIHTYVNRDVDGFSYTIARFARLYPLHFATLIFVALLQFVAMAAGQETFTQGVSVYNFIVHLFMVGSWGFGEPYAFNAPIWSVSAELAIYIAFFWLLRLPNFSNMLGQFVIAALFYGMIYSLHYVPFIGDKHLMLTNCAVFFFTGCFMYSLVLRWGHNPLTWPIALIALVASAYDFWLGISLENMVFLFASAIYVFAILDLKKVKGGTLFAPLAAITYTIYLIHVPLQVAILIYTDYLGIDRTIADNPLFFIFFNSTVIALSTIVYRVYEKPMDQKIRNFAMAKREQAKARKFTVAAAE